MLLALGFAFAAPRVVTLPGPTPDAPPRVVQIDERSATWRVGLVGRPPGLHGSWAAARAAARHPVLYPSDAAAEDLFAAANEVAAAHLQDPRRDALVLALLEHSLALPADSPLPHHLAVAVSLSGHPLDALDLPVELQERASHDAAAFRATHRPLGRWWARVDLRDEWLRDTWLASRWTAALQEPLETLLFTHTEWVPRLEALQAIDRWLHGDAWKGLFAAPSAVALHGPEGWLGTVKATRAHLDGGPSRTRIVEHPPEGPIHPSATVEPTPFWEACREAVQDTDAPWGRATRRIEAVRALCASAALQMDVDQGRAETITAAWQDPALPDEVVAILPLRWSHGEPVEGLARVGIRHMDIAIHYDQLPATTPNTTVGTAYRTLLVPVWEPFRLPSPPSPELLATLHSRSSRERATSLHPEPADPAPCGCAKGASGTWFSLLLGLGLVRRRS